MRLRVPSIQTPTWFRDVANAINLLLGDIPEGGTTGQVLAKATDDDFDLEWNTVAAAVHTHPATDVTFAPAGSIAAANVQAAIVELDTEKAAASHTHAIGDVTGLQAAIDLKLDIASYTAADVLAKILTVDGAGSGLDADLLDGQSSAAFAAAAHTHIIADITGLQAALDAKLDDTQATAFGLSLLDDANAAAARTTLGLGTAATQNTGTSGATLIFANGNNTHAGNNTFSGTNVFTNQNAQTIRGRFPYVQFDAQPTGGGANWTGYLQIGVTQTGTGEGNYLSYQVPAGKGVAFSVAGTCRLEVNGTGIDVTGESRCDSFRIDVAPTAAAVAQTHHVPININGVTYKLLLAS